MDVAGSLEKEDHYHNYNFTMKKEKENQEYLDNTLENECVVNQYKADFGGYRPHFEGRNPNQKPNTFWTYVACFLLCLPAYILGTGLFILCIWIATIVPDIYCYVCLGILIATVVLLILISYIGSFDRRKREKVYIKNKEKQLEEVKVLIKKEHDEADRLLLTAAK